MAQVVRTGPPRSADRGRFRGGIGRPPGGRWYKAVHVKSPPAQQVRALPAARQLLVRQANDLALGVRGMLRNFGLGTIGKAGFAGRVRELVAKTRNLTGIVEPLPAARDTCLRQLAGLHRQALRA